MRQYQPSDPRIIIDQDVLSESYLLPEMRTRQPKLNEISLCLRPVTEGSEPVNCWIYGNSGVGKTATARMILHKLEDESGVRGVYINCWENPTFFSILDYIARELRMLGAEKLSTSYKLEKLKKHLNGQGIILILDEIDQCPPRERNAILYNLANFPALGIICICNSQSVYFDLEDRVKSRLNPARILFEEYSAEDLLNILNQRAQYALASGSFENGLLHDIAQLSSGDARIAIQTLKNAAYLAEKDHNETIECHHVHRAWNSAKDLKKTYLLRKLTDHHHLLHELIAENNGILSGALWRLYLQVCKRRKIKPIAERTYSDYCNSLVKVGLIEAKRAAIKGKVRQFQIIH